MHTSSEIRLSLLVPLCTVDSLVKPTKPRLQDCAKGKAARHAPCQLPVLVQIALHSMQRACNFGSRVEPSAWRAALRPFGGGWEFAKRTMLDLTPRQLLPDGEDLTGDGAVVKLITVPGSAGGSPTTGPPPPGSVVKVRFVGRAVDTLDCTSGVVFDSSAQRMEGDVPFRAHLGKGTFVAGVELALAGMARGETALLACAAEYAYGAKGALPEVAPHVTVAYEVTLCTFRPPLVAPGTSLTSESRMAGAARLKAVGPTASSMWLLPLVTTAPHSARGLRESVATLSRPAS